MLLHDVISGLKPVVIDLTGRVSTASVSIVVPTYKEALNLPELVRRIEGVVVEHRLTVELLIVDDDSQDGTEQLVVSMDKPWIRLITRRSCRGLSSAVLEGMRAARNDVLLVMDADLSHPPEVIPMMIDGLVNGADFVIGSRYVRGGSTDDSWTAFRWLNSRVATLLARPFTDVHDPMSGFFAIRKELFDRAKWLNPVGYKIGLELLVKCRCDVVGEVPIHFSTRRFGQSKLTLAEQFRYLQHIRRLFAFQHPGWSQLIHFAVVGSIGAVVNLVVLTHLLRWAVDLRLAVAGAIGVSLLGNFWLDKLFRLTYARTPSVLIELLTFIFACLPGAVLNYSATLAVLAQGKVAVSPQVAALIGIAAGVMPDLVIKRYLVLRERRRIPRR